MNIKEAILDWINDGTEETDDLALTNILPLRKALWLRLRFTQRKQEKFLTHYLMIRGENNVAKESKEVIKQMIELYAEAETLEAPVIRLVLQVLLERTGEGISFHDAMKDMFASTYVMVMQAASKAQKQNSEQIMSGDAKNREVAYNKAIKQATNDAIEISKVQQNTQFKSIIGVVAIISSFYIAYASSNYYLEVISANPNADRFINIPHGLFAVGEFVYAYFPVISGLLLGFFIIQRYLMNNWVGENRDILDRYWPPFIVYRYVSGLNIFSGLSLLIGHIGYESLKAITTLHESANVYEQFHLDIMRDKLGEGEGGTTQLDTGLLTKSLQLTLRVSGKGESSSISSALKIINTQGKKDLIKTLQYVSTIFMIVLVLIAVWVSVTVGSASAFLYQTTMGV